MREHAKNTALRIKAAVTSLPSTAVRESGLWLAQIAGVVLVVDGIADWSQPAAKIVAGLTAVGVAEMWSRGGDDGRA